MTDENDLQAAITADNGVATQNKELRNAVLDRRGFLLKSASVAGSISAPALIGGGALVISRSAIAGTSNRQRMYAKDDKPFFDETIRLGLPDWDYAEANWQVNSEAGGGNAQEHAGGLVLIKQWYFFSWPVTTVVATYAFRMHTKEQVHGTGLSGAQDLDSTKDQYIALIPQNSDVWAPLPDTAPKFDGSELRRRLDYDEDWGTNWSVPESWVQEFQMWYDEEHRETGMPTFGVLIHQWGGRASGVAMRVIYVYRFGYRRMLGHWQRRATLRRTMYLFGGNIRGQWANLAIDDIQEGMRPHLREVARAIYLAARIDNPVDIRMDHMPEPFNGWRNNIVGQGNIVRGAVVAMLARLVGGLGLAMPLLRANNQAGRAFEALRNDWPYFDNGVYNVRDAPEGLPGPYPRRFAGVQASVYVRFYLLNLTEAEGHLDRNFWLHVPPLVNVWEDLARDDVTRAMEDRPNIDLGPQARWPAIFPGQPDNGNTSTDTSDEGSVVSSIEADLDGFPHNPADGSINALLSDL